MAPSINRLSTALDKSPELFASIRPDLVALVGPLAERSEKLLCERGDFLPHAAALTDEGKVAMLGSQSPNASGKLVLG